MMYLIQVTTYTGIMYLVYALLLRNKPIHAFNRAYLLGTALLPLVLPFIKLPTYNQYFEKARVANVRLPEVIAASGYEKHVVSQTVNWVLIAYVTVACLLFALFVYKRIRLQMVIRKSTRIQEKGYTILLNTTYGPGSWGRYILLPDETINETIIQHEAAHVYMKHSTDVVLMQLLQCICWPNLFLYAINKELKQIHEFQADAAVGMDRLQYSELLLSNVFDTCSLPLTHSFNIHPIKRRIIMLKKKRSSMSLLFGGLALLLTGAIVFNMIALQSCKPKKWEVMQAMQVDKGAEFDGDLYRFVTENIKYPKEAMDNGIEGRVVIGFKIDEDGYVKDPQVVRENYSFANGTNVNDIKPGVLVAAAMDVINKMPRWIPAEKDGRKVAMYFQQPFTFRLPKDSVVGYLYEKASGYGVNGMPVYKSDVKGHHVNDYYKIAMNILNDISGRNSNQNIRKNGYWSMYTEGVSEKEHASIAKIQHEYDSIQLDHLPKQSEVDYQIDKVKGVVYNLSNAKPDRVDGNSASWNLSQMKPDTVYDKK